jgi:hypothetical protein
MPDEATGFTFDGAIPRSAADHFLASGSPLSLAGTTVADATITISGSDGKSRALPRQATPRAGFGWILRLWLTRRA